MGLRTLTSGAIMIAGLLALSACETTTEASDESAVSRAEFRKELPPELYDFAMSAALAEGIAENCRSINFNRSAANARMQALDSDLKAKGYIDSDIRHLSDNLPYKRVQDDFMKYIQQNDIVVNQPSTFCAAGQREIANGTRIGALLKG